MAVARYYASNAVDTTLSTGISSADLTMTVASASGFPQSYPYTLAIDYDTSSEELVDVTGASSTTLTITRAVDSTTAVSHAGGANVKHVISGRDLRETQEHYNATGRYSVANGTTTEYFNLHGIGLNEGNVVGTDKAQTLTAKTLTSPTINGATLGGTTTNSGTISGGTITATTLATPRNINGVPFNGSADVTVPAAAGTLTGSALASGVTSAPGLTVTESQVLNLTTDLANKLTNPGAWSSWTPTLSWTLNSLTNRSEYIQIGKTVYFNLDLSSTGTISPSGTFTFTLPVQPTQSAWVSGNWSVGYYPGVSNYPITVSFNAGSTTATMYVPTATSTTANTALSSLSLTSAIIPLGATTTATGRTINITGFYEVA
jgi:hypothetical protein